MQIFTVSEFTFALKALLEPPFRAVSIRGEISNLKLQSSGHYYFSLKDSGAQLSAVLFKGSASKLLRTPKEGDQVVALGELSIYAPRGNYQLVVRELQLVGVGELLMKLHQKKEELKAKGWFEMERKKKLPQLPKRIGVVTSPTGAAIQDILNVLTRRFHGLHVILNPVKVQGEGSAEEIAQAIHDFNRYELADVLIVGRGGGSIEDLWAFNEEIVAKAIYESKIPVISAVGHETDTTIADWVADVRAPTPSAAAEIAIAEKANLLKFLTQAQSFAEQKLRQQVLAIKGKLHSLQKHPLFSSPYAILSESWQRLDDLEQEVTNALRMGVQERRRKLETMGTHIALLEPSGRIREWKHRLSVYRDRIQNAIHPLLCQRKERLQRIGEHLRSLHPHHLLKKGYAILFKEHGDSILLSASDIAKGESFRALLHDGKLTATVNHIENHHGPRSTLF